MRAAAVVPAAGLALLLAGCGSPSAADELTARVDDVTVAANARDAAGLREAAQSLADTASAERDAGRLSEAQAQRLIALAGELRTGADAVDPEAQARQEAEARAREAAEKAEAEAKVRAAEQARAQEQARAAEQARAQEEAERARQQPDGDDEGRGKGDKDGKKGEGKDEKGED